MERVKGREGGERERGSGRRKERRWELNYVQSCYSSLEA